ncbi:MAG: M20/M25/M40 family metallo-hydrolase [Planctomycetota bacterium]
MRTFAVSFAFLLVAPLWAQVAPEQFERIRQEGLERSKVMAHLDHLVNRIGPRLTSSDNLTVACEWARDEFAAMGLDNPRLEQWGTMDVGFNRGPWWGRMVEPEELELVCATDAWSAGTRGPARGPVMRAPKNDEELAAMASGWKGAWILGVPRDMLTKVADAIVANGAHGMLASSSGDLVLTGGSARVKFDDLPAVPIVRIQKEGYDAIAELVDADKPCVVEFDIRNHFKKGPIPLFNVIADIVGSEKPNEFVVVGGHIDSWDGATGTTDNGTGTATTMEAARILMAIGAKPKRTIRFMLWSGEEQGLLGSRAWVQAHKAELAKYSACLVHDGGTNYVSGMAGMKEMRPQLETAFEHVLKWQTDMPFAIREIEAFSPIGSDHESFTAEDVPGFFWDQRGRANYTHTHHTQYDSYAAAIPEYQMHTSVVVATGALGLANLDSLLTRENMKVQRGFGGGQRNRRMLGVTLRDDGVTIDAISDGSVAKTAGLAAGDKLVRIGDQAVTSQDDLRRALAAGGPEKTIVVKRGDQEVTVAVKFAR